MGGPVRIAVGFMAIVALAFGAFTEEVKKEEKKDDKKVEKKADKKDEGPKIPSKDDGVMYSQDSIEKFTPVILSPAVLKTKNLEMPWFGDVKKWSKVRKEVIPNPNPTSQQQPPYATFALPLKYPIDPQTWAGAAEGTKFMATNTPAMFMEVDVNADGKLKGPAESLNKNDDGTYGPVLTVLKYEGIPGATYSFILALEAEDPNHYYRFRTNVAWEGTIPSKKKPAKETEKVMLIDANNDALFDDYGVDEIIVGDKPAMPLPQLILIKGQLYHLRVHQSGSYVQTKPFDGPMGKLDVFSKLDLPKGTKVESMVIQNETGAFSIDIAPGAKAMNWGSEPPVTLPVGKYSVVKGIISMGKDEVIVRQGDMAMWDVKNGGTTVAEWGQPFSLTAEITANITGLNIDKIKVEGKSKEAYITVGAAAPTVTVKFKGKEEKSQVQLDKDGMFAAWFLDPGKKGIYKVGIAMKHKLLGSLEVAEQELSYKPASAE